MKKTGREILLIVIIMIVLMIPIFIFVSNDKKETEYNNFIQHIEEGARKWARGNMQQINSGTIKLGELKKISFVDYNLKNPKTGLHLSNESYIIISKTNDGKYNFDLKLYELPKEETNADLVIQMIGKKVLQNGISAPYNELGIEVHEGNEALAYSIQYFTKGEEVLSIDTSRPRNYEVVYTVLNSRGELAKVVRKVIIQ